MNKIISVLLISLIITFINGCANQIESSDLHFQTDKHEEELMSENNNSKIMIDNNVIAECDSWEFFRGKCGPEFSYCSMQGYKLKNLSNNEGWSKGGICTDNNGLEIGTISELMNLSKYGSVDISLAYCKELGYLHELRENENGQFSICIFSEQVKTNESKNEIDKNDVNKTTTHKIYDWNIELIFCKNCSSYKSENISQEELSRIKDEFISNFETGELIFDKFRKNGFFVNGTNEVRYILDKAEITGATLKTTYFKLIIIDKMQKEPLTNEEIYQCNEDRECISVNSRCCGCGSGGSAISINKNYLNFWNNKISNECRGIGCATVMSGHISCLSEPKCINNVCTLIPHKETVCNSLRFKNCNSTFEERMDEIIGNNNVSCREIISICED